MSHPVSVIYVNYNTSELLIKSIRSLEENCNRTPFEVIIVDNGSREQEVSILNNWLQNRQGDRIRVILSGENLGFAKANNLGAAHADARYLFFLNPDTFVLNDVIGIFHDYMESSALDVAACGGNLLHEDLTSNSSFGNFPGVLLECCNVGLGLSFILNGYYAQKIAIGSPIRSEKIFEVPYIVGADIFIRAEVFKNIGQFDPRFFMYYEETDLFFRLSRAGYRSYVLPNARIVHLEGGSVGASSVAGFNYAKFQMILRSKLYYYTKWHKGSLPIIKSLIKSQIFVQYMKGKWGNDLQKLYRIYAEIAG